MVRIQDASYIRTRHFFVRLIFEPILYSGASYKSKCILEAMKKKLITSALGDTSIHTDLTAKIGMVFVGNFYPPCWPVGARKAEKCKTL